MFRVSEGSGIQKALKFGLVPPYISTARKFSWIANSLRMGSFTGIYIFFGIFTQVPSENVVTGNEEGILFYK